MAAGGRGWSGTERGEEPETEEGCGRQEGAQRPLLASAENGNLANRCKLWEKRAILMDPLAFQVGILLLTCKDSPRWCYNACMNYKRTVTK